VKRLTPITAIEKANAKGLETVAKQVLAPHFHGEGQASKKVSFPTISPFIGVDDMNAFDAHAYVQADALHKFAIRPSIRNNKELTRDDVIRTVAAIVGPGHKVDLQGYDLLILVEIYKVHLQSCDHACFVVPPLRS
jgi:tRNA acetyltransferase TAN1